MEREREGKEKRGEQRARAHRRTARAAAADRPPVVSCDACADTREASYMIVHRRYAICPRCIEFVRDLDLVDDRARLADQGYDFAVRETRRELLRRDGPYTASARVARAWFGLDGGDAATTPVAGESLVRGDGRQ